MTLTLGVEISRSESEGTLSQEWHGRLTWNEKDVSYPFMTMIVTRVTMVGWADVPDSERGDFRRRSAVDISSSLHNVCVSFSAKALIVLYMMPLCLIFSQGSHCSLHDAFMSRFQPRLSLFSTWCLYVLFSAKALIVLYMMPLCLVFCQGFHSSLHDAFMSRFQPRLSLFSANLMTQKHSDSLFRH